MADKNEDNEFRLEDLEDLTSAELLDPVGELHSKKTCTQTAGFKKEQFQTTSQPRAHGRP